jgi:hypothetical protein
MYSSANAVATTSRPVEIAWSTRDHRSERSPACLPTFVKLAGGR